LITANDYPFYSWGGAQNSYAADDSLMYHSDEFDKGIGTQQGKSTRNGYAYHRDFEHCSVDVNLKTKTSSIVLKPSAPSKESIIERCLSVLWENKIKKITSHPSNFHSIWSIPP
jgi:hypothetical protein